MRHERPRKTHEMPTLCREYNVPLVSTWTIGQPDRSTSSADVAFWVAYWAQPRVIMYGPYEESVDQNMRELIFPWNGHDEPSNPSVLDDNVRWLKDHPRVRFYVEAYASS